MKRHLLLWLLICGFAPAVWAQQQAVPRVVVSIKPIHSLVAAVMEGVGEPQLLVKGAGSPHGYALRPSEAQMLAEAGLVVWVGEGLETFLQRPLATLGKSAQQLELADHLQDRMLPVRAGGPWEGHAHDHQGDDHKDAHHGDDHAHASLKSLNHHIWTSPLVAKEIVHHVAVTLSNMDPSHQAQYQKNAAELQKKLELLYQEVRQQLAPVSSTPYIVFHDAYQYFERDFRLNAVGSVTIDTERSPGARRIKEVRGKITELGARAVFSEPQFQSRIVATVLEGTGAKAGVLDPLGAELAEGPEAYFSLIRTMATSILSTLR
ncbi:zinc ABC transporter substrate-binding protein [Pelovirga terrestris]|uniref:Zinc ABC transporter substrate-binding protein n=1 Tax=Pelovirga terrestris TaxID=2771352 RepID=A0A8J6QPN7_9BACT|nr:zinc ABC transporter substrate-binding protein [Pelovirga terrestris]MBD1400298.1 zinc ABC transporter substrate-binding protein [Pelovirga terrestris]